MISKFGSGGIQFQGCVLDPAKVISFSFCYHEPQHVPNRDKILAYLIKNGVDLETDFSAIFDADGNEDIVLVFGNPETLLNFQALVGVLVTDEKGKAGK